MVEIGAGEIALCVGIAFIVLAGSAMRARTAALAFALIPAVVYLGGGSAALVRESSAAAGVSMLVGAGVGKLLHIGTS